MFGLICGCAVGSCLWGWQSFIVATSIPMVLIIMALGASIVSRVCKASSGALDHIVAAFNVVIFLQCALACGTTVAFRQCWATCTLTPVLDLTDPALGSQVMGMQSCHEVVSAMPNSNGEYPRYVDVL